MGNKLLVFILFILTFLIEAYAESYDTLSLDSRYDQIPYHPHRTNIDIGLSMNGTNQVPINNSTKILPSNPVSEMKLTQEIANVTVTEDQIQDLEHYNLPLGLIVLNNDPKAEYETLRDGSMLILRSNQITIIYYGDARYNGSMENTIIDLDAFGPVKIPVNLSVSWSQALERPISKENGKKLADTRQHRSILTNEELLAAAAKSGTGTKVDYFNGMQRIFFGSQSSILDKTTESFTYYSGGSVSIRPSNGMRLDTSLGISLNQIAAEYGFIQENDAKDLRKYMLTEPNASK
jgi:hypothetical protein